MKLWPLIFLVALSVAQAEIGSVTELTGSATIKRGSNTVAIAKGTAIEINDKVTAQNGEVKITFKDNTTVKVTASSSMVIDDFVYDPKTQGGKLGLKATEGTVRYVSGNIAHNNPNAVNIKTPTAAIAVRGTDFIMSSDETGKSMIILMPSCEVEQNVNLKGLTCGSGKIDVNSGGEIIHMDKPFQATMVETNGTPPSPPVVVNLSNTPIGNNLHLSPPQTMSGQSIVAAAKAAAVKTGDAKKDVAKKDDTGKQSSSDAGNTPPAETQAQVVQQQQQRQQQAQADQQAAAQAAASALQQAAKEQAALEAQGVTVNSTPITDANVFAVFHNNDPTLNQIGWGYASLSPSGNNYANVSLPLNSQVLVVVTQDRVTDAYNFAGGNNKPQGSITITQTYNTK